ncbi:MAG TPA: CPBP family intramembrane glutamic endopeptidase [Acidimicrobiales bacterium]|nr:CPBP family intramembrane glutamic endopeptidase [Acidimicrobiales bacterium]
MTGGRRAEMVLLFGVGPALLALGPRWTVTVGILATGVVCGLLLLLDPTFPRSELVGMPGFRRGVRAVLARTAVFGALLLGGAAVLAGKPLLPRAHPGLWALIMVLYPISAYAQELVCRTFFFHRYGALFDRPVARVLASGLAFGWAHVAVNNVPALVLATAAGLVFASTYERWRSTLLVGLEHALYGDLAFSAGLGSLFYASARWFKLWGHQ